MGRQPDDERVLYSFYISRAAKTAIEDLAKTHEVNTSEMIRRMLKFSYERRAQLALTRLPSVGEGRELRNKRPK